MVSMPVIDSFLLRDGWLINPRGHAERLRSACDGADGILDAMVRELPRLGLYFPKIVVARHGDWSLDPRPMAPESLEVNARLVVHTEPDRRVNPRVKGPDFPWQESVRGAAVSRGASDGVLVEPDNPEVVRETAFGTLAAWVDGTLVTSSSPCRLPSTTEGALLGLAAEWDTPVVARMLTLADLRGADAVWLLSALHTIRTVTHLDGKPLRTAADADAWRAALWLRARPVTELSEAS